MNLIAQRFEEFLTSRRAPNPAGEDDFSQFLRELAKGGGVPDYSEDQWIAFGLDFGLDAERTAALVEQAASWVRDTTDGGARPPTPAAWA